MSIFHVFGHDDDDILLIVNMVKMMKVMIYNFCTLLIHIPSDCEAKMSFSDKHLKLIYQIIS